MRNAVWKTIAALALAGMAGCSERTVQSDDILAREAVTADAKVKHVLIAWKELAPAFQGRLDARAAERTKEEADRLALEILDKARKGEPSFEVLMRDHSEDTNNARTGEAYGVSPSARLVAPFKNLGLRLEVGEVGIVETRYGWHIIKRVE